MSKAPENMPTETIRAFIESAENGEKEWRKVEAEAYARLQTAIRAQAERRSTAIKYRGWLWDRESNA